MPKIVKVSVEINIPQFLQHLTSDVKVVNSSGGNVGECLDDLVKRFPQVKSRLFNDNGELLKYLEIYINGESAYPEELSKPVVDGDELHIVNIIVGG